MGQGRKNVGVLNEASINDAVTIGKYEGNLGSRSRRNHLYDEAKFSKVVLSNVLD